MSKRMNAKTQSDMRGKGSSGDGNGDMTAELWGEVYDMLCAKIKAENAYAKIRSKMRKLTEPKKVAPKKTIKKTQKKKTSKPAAAASASASTTTTAAVAATTTITTEPVTTTAAAAAAADSETKVTSFLKPATPAKRRPRKKLSLKISHQEQLEAIDCTCFTDGPLTCLGPVWDSMMEDHILCLYERFSGFYPLPPQKRLCRPLGGAHATGNGCAVILEARATGNECDAVLDAYT
ncbi:uncharacterized protein [Haliotis cracherodii]|uniref:uncharacterized protein n=1 Tax=Haliotis cracherodii TaxID=6455 RepID=UPI0039E91399